MRAEGNKWSFAFLPFLSSFPSLQLAAVTLVCARADVAALGGSDLKLAGIGIDHRHVPAKAPRSSSRRTIWTGTSSTPTSPATICCSPGTRRTTCSLTGAWMSTGGRIAPVHRGPQRRDGMGENPRGALGRDLRPGDEDVHRNPAAGRAAPLARLGAGLLGQPLGGVRPARAGPAGVPAADAYVYSVRPDDFDETVLQSPEAPRARGAGLPRRSCAKTRSAPVRDVLPRRECLLQRDQRRRGAGAAPKGGRARSGERHVLLRARRRAARRRETSEEAERPLLRRRRSKRRTALSAPGGRLRAASWSVVSGTFRCSASRRATWSEALAAARRGARGSGRT